MLEFSKKRCKKCLLQEDPVNYITIDDNMICNLCKIKNEEEKKDWNYLKELLDKIIEKNRGKSKYDAVVMMSGGKDSAYLAYILKKVYGLNILGITNDIHYEYQETFENAKLICDKLSIPLIINKIPEWKMTEFYRFLFLTKELKDKKCGHICNYCGRFMIRTVAEYAKEHNIPMIFSGHNPEQIDGMGQNIAVGSKAVLRKKLLNQMIDNSIEKAINNIPKDKEFLLPMFSKELFPEGVTGVFMYQYFPYEPVKMMEVVTKELNWKPIKKLSSTYIASGCKLASLWMKVSHLNKTSNYMDLELSAQIRSGVLSKELVENFYNNSYDNEDEINDLLKDLKIDNIKDLM